jgi:DNA-binding transcriptional LysR family regulator
MAVTNMRWISVFVRTAELGSLRSAAKDLAISPQAAGQALAQLETQLGVRLIHRTTRVMSLTEDGQRLLADVQPALQSLQFALDRAKVSKDEFAGALRIVGPRTGFQQVLWPILDEFCTEHPKVRPEVTLEDRKGNWVEDRVDVGFRLGSPDEGVIAKRLFPLQLLICGAPGYFETHGIPNSVEALSSHRCSGYRTADGRAVAPWYLKVDGNVIAHRFSPAICTNDETLELSAVLAGKVLGQLTSVAAAPFIRSGQLVPVLLDYRPDHASYFVYFGSRISRPARTQAFIDLAVKRLSGTNSYVLTEAELKAARSYCA